MKDDSSPPGVMAACAAQRRFNGCRSDVRAGVDYHGVAREGGAASGGFPHLAANGLGGAVVARSDGTAKKTSKTRKTTQVFGGFADGRSIVVNSGKSPTYGCPYRTPVNSMALRTQLPVLSQSLRWLGAHPAFGWVAVASAAVLSRQPQCPGRALAPLSSEWLSDIKRQKMQGREF